MLDKIKGLVTITEGKEKDLESYLEGLTCVNPEGVQKFLETEDGKKLLQPTLDKYHNKGLETWKTNNLGKLVEDEIVKKFPQETEEQKKLRQLEKSLEDEKGARIRETLKNKALSIATQKKLPIELVEYFVGQDEETTASNLTTFENIWNNAIKAAVEVKFKEGGREVHKTKEEAKTEVEKLKEQLKKTTKIEERVALMNQIRAMEKKE